MNHPGAPGVTHLNLYQVLVVVLNTLVLDSAELDVRTQSNSIPL